MGSRRVDVALVSGVALILGLIRLGAPSLWVDEAATARAVESSLLNLFDGYHGLYYSIETAWTFFAGTSEWALRLPSVFGTMIACALLVVLAHKLFDRWVGLVAGLLLATSPFVVKWSQQARGYTFLLAVSLLATLLLLRALERGSRRAWALYGVGFAAVLVWHPVAGLVLMPAHGVLIAQRRERVLPHGLLAAVVIGALGVPWVAQIAIRSSGEGASINWLKAPSLEVAARAVSDISGAAGLGLLLAAVGIWVLQRAGNAPLAVWLSAWAFAPFVLALAVSTVKPVFLDRYLIVAAPAFALLAGVALTGVSTRLRAVAVLAVVIATTIGLVSWYSSGDKGNWRAEDWRSAVATVLAKRAENEPIVVAPWSANPSATYYGADVVDVSTSDSIWVLTWSETGAEFRESDRRALGFGEHRLVERLQFGRRVSVQHWVRSLE